MAVKVTTSFNVKRVIDEVRGRALDYGFDKAQALIRDLRCPEHNEPVTISMEGETRQMKITGCCEAFRQRVVEIIGRK